MKGENFIGNNFWIILQKVVEHVTGDN